MLSLKSAIAMFLGIVFRVLCEVLYFWFGEAQPEPRTRMVEGERTHMVLGKPAERLEFYLM